MEIVIEKVRIDVTEFLSQNKSWTMKERNTPEFQQVYNAWAERMRIKNEYADWKNKEHNEWLEKGCPEND